MHHWSPPYDVVLKLLKRDGKVTRSCPQGWPLGIEPHSHVMVVHLIIQLDRTLEFHPRNFRTIL